MSGAQPLADLLFSVINDNVVTNMFPCNRLKVLPSNTPYRRNGVRMNCIYLLQARNWVRFCLKLKEVDTKCPTRCPFFTEGNPSSYQEAVEKELDIECLYCTRQMVSHLNNEKEFLFYCDLYKSSPPLCARCFYARYDNED